MAEATGQSGYSLSPAGADAFVRRLTQQFDVWAPVRLPGRGRFSDSDRVRYGTVQNWADVVWQRKSDFSPKVVVFPVNETVWHFVGDRVIEPDVAVRPTLVLLRACDIHGFSRLDQMFLRNGGHVDPLYARRREQVRFGLLECREPFDNCFCVSMGTNRTDTWDLAIRPTDTQVWVSAREASVRDCLPPEAAPAEFVPEYVTADRVPVRVPDAARTARAIRDEHLFEHPFWNEYDRRCIACGRCNTSCVTCTCFSTDDVVSDDNPTVGERRRAWAGCHIDRFTGMAGGHSLREKNGARMRFKTMHKVYDYRLRFGAQAGHMCVGCGRCDDQCPQYISFSTCINRLYDLLGDGGSA